MRGAFRAPGLDTLPIAHKPVPRAAHARDGVQTYQARASNAPAVGRTQHAAAPWPLSVSWGIDDANQSGKGAQRTG
eukprot:2614157-Prymnesium_polylepis.1